MAALSQDDYYSFLQNLLKLASVIECRPNNLATSKSTIAGGYGGTGESAATLITAISATITALG